LDEGGVATFFGEVQNTSSAGTYACNIVLTIQVTLATGDEITMTVSMNGRTMLLSGKTNEHCLKGGSTGVFRYRTDLPTPLITDFEVTSVSSEYKNIQLSGLESQIDIVGPITETTVNDVKQYTITLMNSDATGTAYFPKFTIATLDSSGLVDGLFTAYPNADLSDPAAACQIAGITGNVPCLPPGKSLTFTIDATGLTVADIDSFYSLIDWMESGDFG
jgi:hypothetical protein